MLDESANIQKIINVIQTLEKYGKKEAIDSGFIQGFCNKLSRENRRWITKEKIDNCDFMEALYELLAINDELKITSFENKKIYRNQFSVKPDGTSTKEKKKPCCSLCKGDHLTYLCGQLSSLSELKKRIELLKGKKVCVKCLFAFNKEHTCPCYKQRFICREHKTNYSVCRCTRKKVEGTGVMETGAITDSDIMIEPSTANNVAKINGNML